VSPHRQRPDVLRGGVGQPMLFSIVWTVLASAIYFALGVIAGYALGLTPVVFVVSALMFALAAMTYVEGAALYPERAGSTVFARHAFNELWSFVAGWAVLLDYVILIAATSFSATNYLAPFWGELGGGGAVELAAIAVILAYVAVRNIRGFSTTRHRRIRLLVGADIALQLLLIAVGAALLFDADLITASIDLGSSPTWEDVIVALGIATVVSTGLESAAGVAAEVEVRRAGLRRLISASSLTVFVVYTGIALIAMSAEPVVDGTTRLATTFEEAPVLGIAAGFEQEWLRETLTYAIGAVAAITLIAAANSAMLGLSRLAYALSTNRQIPSGLGRLHPTRFTPWVLITLATLLAGALALPRDLEVMLGIYAFGALLGLTIAHASILRLRISEPTRARPYRIPLNLPVGRFLLPLPAVAGLLLSALAFVSVLVTHDEARWVGLGWMGLGLLLYVTYRRGTGKPLLGRVSVPQEALRGDHVELEYGSILVPISGRPLDDDIMQTAGRLAAEEDLGEGAPTIEALWVFEVPMSLPLDARLPEAELTRARAALARARAVGEEYEGVTVATATVRARRAGHAIVDEARRRGVQAIVLAAEEPSRIRGGARLGGIAGDAAIGDLTRTVVAKAGCAVILTAPGPEDPGPETAAPR
jgi:APA family basic amino acid/polyamine antiporter